MMSSNSYYRTHEHSEPSRLFDNENIDWVPTLNLPYKNESEELRQRREKISIQAYQRFYRKRQREKVAKQSKAAEAGIDNGAEENVTNDIVPKRPFIDLATQTDITSNDISGVEFMFAQQTEKIKALQNHILKSLPLSKKSLNSDDELVKFYTGFPNFTVLMFVFNMVSPNVQSSNTKDKTFCEYFICLMRLRLNIPLQDLAFRFQVSLATASGYFDKWIDALYASLKPFVCWPDRDEIISSAPKAFREAFGNKIAVIIDCLEVLVEKPSSPDARAATWSNYKNTYTAKILIGITPQGLISFLSKGWGGRASDRHITKNCGLLNYLNPSDIIMADGGFNISEVLLEMNTSAAVPIFTKGLNQLPLLEVLRIMERKKSRLRVHVDRVIGRVQQKFLIFSGPFPIQFLEANEEDVAPLDKIALIASAICNMSEPIVTNEDGFDTLLRKD